MVKLNFKRMDFYQEFFSPVIIYEAFSVLLEY